MKPFAPDSPRQRLLTPPPRGALCWALLAAWLPALVGCSSGPLVRHQGQVDLDLAQSYQATILVPGGHLEVGGTDEAFVTYSTFTRTHAEPRLSCATDRDSVGQVCFAQDRKFSECGDNKWAVNLSRNHPGTLEIDLAAGDVRVDARELRLSQLDLDVGAGEVRLDLSQQWPRNLLVRVDVGLGEVRIKVPRSVGVKLRCDTGLGSLKAPTFDPRGSHWVNAAYDPSAPCITLDIDLGIGEVRVEEVDSVPPPAKSVST